MGLSTCAKCCILAILCQSAIALQVHLSECTLRDVRATNAKRWPCVSFDNTGNVHYEGEDVSISLIIEFPLPIYTQLLSDHSKISIVTAGGQNLTSGQHILRKQDRDRWTVQLIFQPVDDEYGRLNLVLHILNLQYRDEQMLRVEIRTDDTTFKTIDQRWAPVYKRNMNDDGDTDDEGDLHVVLTTITMENPAAEELMSQLQAEIKDLKNKNEALQHQVMAVQDSLIHCQTKYSSCLESNHGPNVLDIITFCMQMGGIFVVVGIVIFAVFYRKFRVDTWNINGVQTDQLKRLLPGRTAIIQQDDKPQQQSLLNSANTELHVPADVGDV